ncbi:hypothetical protein E2C01_084303 [Portunus trituberculatus]|uniref:Uncharacterized protein n=1 Tax=Portunus trituberculatus TaxID=210409 RepID=A0A5B7IUX5_PORTR|nr:hypothetical protein [Portunus trituberculatus]
MHTVISNNFHLETTLNALLNRSSSGGQAASSAAAAGGGSGSGVSPQSLPQREKRVRNRVSDEKAKRYPTEQAQSSLFPIFG